MSTLDLSLGALEIGVLISSVLYGIATLQAFMYSGGKFKDPLWLQTLVGAVWALETAHTVTLWVYVYSLTITHYGDHAAINRTDLSLGIAFPLSSILGSLVQGFYAHRVHVLSGRLLIPLIAWAGGLFRFTVGVYLGVWVVKLKTIPQFFEHYEWLVATQFGLSAAVDVMNTATLCYYLLRRRSGFKSTQRLIDKLITYTVETGLITSLFGLAIVVTSQTMHDNFVDFGIFVIYPKLFSNSFFSSLNARPGLREGHHAMGTQNLSLGIFAQPSTHRDGAGIALQLSERGSGNSNIAAENVSVPWSTSSLDENTRKDHTFA